MHFGKLHEKSVKIGKDQTLPENVRCFPLVVIITTANGMHSTFTGRHPEVFFIISDRYRDIMDFAEVQTDIARSFVKSVKPLIPSKCLSFFLDTAASFSVSWRTPTQTGRTRSSETY